MLVKNILKNDAYRDHLLKRKYARVEIKRLLLKALSKNSYLPKKFFFSKRSHLYLKSTRRRNRCLITNFSRSLIKNTKMHRFVFRILVEEGKISGFTR